MYSIGCGTWFGNKSPEKRESNCFVECAASVFWNTEVWVKVKVKVKVKFTLEQAMKTQRGSRGIALLFL